MTQKGDLLFAKHILDSINAILDFSKEMTIEELRTNRLKQTAIVRETEIIGEAAKNISEETKKKHPEVEWKGIIGTRDKMIHHYFGVDISVVWSIITENLPLLKEQILKIEKEITI